MCLHSLLFRIIIPTPSPHNPSPFYFSFCNSHSRAVLSQLQLIQINLNSYFYLQVLFISHSLYISPFPISLSSSSTSYPLVFFHPMLIPRRHQIPFVWILSPLTPPTQSFYLIHISSRFFVILHSARKESRHKYRHRTVDKRFLA
jgi:hypothetical protein